MYYTVCVSFVGALKMQLFYLKCTEWENLRREFLVKIYHQSMINYERKRF